MPKKLIPMAIAYEVEAESLTTQKRGLMQKLLTGQWRLPIQEGAGKT